MSMVCCTMASQTKPFARCSIVDLAYEISLAASASPSGSALDSAAAQLLLPSLRNADLVEAVLQRHPRVQSSEGLMCFATPASQQAWCEMLRDLFQSAGVAVSDAACLRVYLVLKECAKRGRVTLAPARSSHLLHDHFLGKNVCISFAWRSAPASRSRSSSFSLQCCSMSSVSTTSTPRRHYVRSSNLRRKGMGVLRRRAACLPGWRQPPSDSSRPLPPTFLCQGNANTAS